MLPTRMLVKLYQNVKVFVLKRYQMHGAKSIIHLDEAKIMMLYPLVLKFLCEIKNILNGEISSDFPPGIAKEV